MAFCYLPSALVKKYPEMSVTNKYVQSKITQIVSCYA